MATSKPKISATEPATQAPPKLALKWRVVISILVVLHLAAVIAAPFSSPPSSQLSRQAWTALSPYIFAAYLNHGYRFFAPNPSPGHVLRYELEMPDGTKSTGQLPDLSTEWPRLLYHRHFMLVEKLLGFLPPPQDEIAADVPPDVRQEWKMMQSAFNTVADCYAAHLLESSGAKRVTLQLASHELPTPVEVRSGWPLNDPTLFRTLWTKSYEADKL